MIASTWKALMDNPTACRGGRSISASSAVAVRSRLAATSAADRLAPGNSRSRSSGTPTSDSSPTHGSYLDLGLHDVSSPDIVLFGFDLLDFERFCAYVRLAGRSPIRHGNRHRAP